MPVWSDELLNRLFTITKTKTPTALAHALETTKQNLHGDKKRKVMPEVLLRRAAHKCGVDYDWLLTGEGKPYMNTEPRRERKTREDQTGEMATLIKELRRQPNAAPWVRDLLRILRDGGERRRLGIESNIEAFIVSMGVDPYASQRDRGGGG